MAFAFFGSFTAAGIYQDNSIDEMSKRYKKELTAEELANLSDKEIDYSDIPELEDDCLHGFCPVRCGTDKLRVKRLHFLRDKAILGFWAQRHEMVHSTSRNPQMGELRRFSGRIPNRWLRRSRLTLFRPHGRGAFSSSAHILFENRCLLPFQERYSPVRNRCNLR